MTPGYWQFETTGVLRPVVERYLRHEPMSATDVVTMRAYLKQWIVAPGFHGEEVHFLRQWVELIETPADLRKWIDAADEAGVDPL